MGKEKVFAVIGLGTFGNAVCKGLAEKGAKVIAIDNHEKQINKVKNDVAQAIMIDTTDQEALMNAGLDDVDIAIVGIGDDIDASILTTAILREMGIPVIVARAINDIHAKVLKKVGASEVIVIEVDQGKRLANRLYAPFIMSFTPVSKNYSIAEIITPKEFEKKSVKDLDLRKNYNVNIILIQRSESKIDESGNPFKVQREILPAPAVILMPDDVLMIFGSEDNIAKMKGK